MTRENLVDNSVPVRDVMSKALISVIPSTTSFQVAKMMERGGIGAVIVKENENPVGIITDRDYATKLAANSLSSNTPVGKIMSSPLVTVDHSDSIFFAAKMMTSKKIRKLAVLEKNKIVGIVTSTDLVSQLAR